MNDSVDVKIMRTTAHFDYLIKMNEQLTISQLKDRAQYSPGIMDEPELQELCQIANESTILSVFRNSMGIWWKFKD